MLHAFQLKSEAVRCLWKSEAVRCLSAVSSIWESLRALAILLLALLLGGVTVQHTIEERRNYAVLVSCPIAPPAVMFGAFFKDSICHTRLNWARASDGENRAPTLTQALPAAGEWDPLKPPPENHPFISNDRRKAICCVSLR
eukprot:5657876-Pleurochrysis_carterae.AAC.1